MTVTIKLTNRNAAGGAAARLTTYDLVDTNKNGRWEKKKAGEILMQPGDEQELCVHETRVFTVEEVDAKTGKTVDDKLAAPEPADAPDGANVHGIRPDTNPPAVLVPPQARRRKG